MNDTWLARLMFSVPILCCLALVIKENLIEPYSVVTVQFNVTFPWSGVEDDKVLKKDKDI